MVQPPSFRDAARRHLDDAEHLHGEGRYPNADHLSGLAAECALKELVAAGLGGRVRDGFVYDAQNTRQRGHVGGDNSVWPRIAALTTGRQEPEVIDLLRDDPFAGWWVEDRYASGARVTSAVSYAHLEGARRAARALQAVMLSNMGGV
jgi:hypothetical protein